MSTENKIIDLMEALKASLKRREVRAQEYRVAQTCQCLDAIATVGIVELQPGRKFVGVQGLVLEPRCDRCGAEWRLDHVRGTPA